MTKSGRRLSQGLLLLALGLLIWLSAWSAIMLTRHEGRIATIWVANGLWLGATLLSSRRMACAMLGVGAIGDLAANLMVGDALATAIALTSCNLFEVALATLAMHRLSKPPIRLSGQRSFVHFFGLCVLGSPCLAALLASAALAALKVELLSQSFVHWFLADALGIGIVTPAILAADTGGLIRLFNAGTRPKALRLFCLLIATIAAVFCQDRYPLLFLIPPVLAFLAAELGMAANALAIPLLTLGAFGGTLGGHGPFNLNHGLGTDERMLLIQMFLLSAIVVSAWVANVAEARARALHDLAEANTQLRALASRDALTGIYNRRIFDSVLQRELQLATRGAGPLSLLLIDIDHFKRINDTYGHAAGDERLREIAGRIQLAAKRPNDLAARYGGEEFALVLPSTGPEAARRIAEILRTDISRLRWDVADERLRRLTVSIGVATLEQADQGATAEALLSLADSRLYDAKREGRDRVRLHVVPPAGEAGAMIRLVS